MPESIKAIGESAFSGCKVLADIDIPEGVSVIRQATFRDCESLSTIELPSSINQDAEQGILHVSDAWTTIDIEIPDDEEFDPSKAALVLRDFIYPDESDEPTVCAFVYDGKVYDCFMEDSRCTSSEKIWPVDDDEDDRDEDDE